MNNTVKRLVIYICLSFLPLIGLVMIACAAIGKNFYVSGHAAWISFVGVFGMCIPAVAHLLTRLITKEGFGETYLLPNLKGNLKYYLVAIIMPLIHSFLAIFIVKLVLLPQLSFGDIFHDTIGIPLVLLQIAISILAFFPAFGEEWGWRGYMMPKLIELMGKPAAVIVGGILWGLWHAPLTINGHNFGISYAGYPYIGILLMCVLCIAMNAFLTFLTDRTGSVYPACFAHMLNNNVNMMIVLTAFAKSEVLDELMKKNNVTLFYTELSAILPTAIVCGVFLFIKKSK